MHAGLPCGDSASRATTECWTRGALSHSIGAGVSMADVAQMVDAIQTGTRVERLVLPNAADTTRAADDSAINDAS
jgi:hypothetical protein